MDFIKLFKFTEDFNERLSITNRILKQNKTDEKIKEDLKEIFRILYEEASKEYEENIKLYKENKDKEEFIKEKLEAFKVCAALYKSVNKKTAV